MSNEVAKEDVHFEHDGPTFEYDRIFKCFPKSGNGLLFRLVNTEKNQWAFYNDTEDTIMTVNAKFGSASKVKALRRTRLTHQSNKNDEAKQECAEQVVTECGLADKELCATLLVEPLRTELFIEGTVNGFSLEFQCESAPATDVQFEYRRPTVHYDNIHKCFKNRGNGLLFRLVDNDKKTWYFYNDTRQFNMMVSVQFNNAKSVQALGKTTVEHKSAQYPNGVTLQLTIEPGKTEPFMTGDPRNYKLGFSAEALDAAKPQPESELKYKNGTPDPVLVSNNCKVYKCFKDHDNGLLFRIVDEERQQWAFYNDTTDYIMATKVRFPLSEKFQVMPDAVKEADPQDENTVIVKMVIPPVTTRVLIRGLPETFSIGFSAESAEKLYDEKDPHFENGQPDRSIIDYTSIYRCFKSSEKELLFRLVDANNNVWGFYNDTTDKVTTAKVAFDNPEEIERLGNTRVESNEQMGTVHVLDVKPKTTELFIKGEIKGFKGKYSATNC